MLWLGSFTLLFHACGPGPAPERELGWFQNPIINGTPDTSTAHKAVVYLQIDVGGGWAAACTGTMITPQVVLTAAHCVCQSNSTSQYAANRFDVFFGNSDSSFTASRSVSEVLRHPNYDYDWYYGAPRNDIALLRLSSNAPSSITPIPHLPVGLALTSADQGTNVDFVGYGQDEYGNTGTKEHVFNAIAKVCTSGNGCNFGDGGLAAPQTMCTDMSPGGPCQGDSGGPATLFRSGQEYVVGVTSYGDQGCDYYGCSTKVDYFDSWINDFVGGVNGSSCTSAGQCDSGRCVDGICCDSACTGICQACNVAGHLGSCTAVPNGTSCADSDPCDGTETCQGGSCVSGSPPSCDDHSVCTVDSCLPGTGCVNDPYANGTSCSDGDKCNGLETCQSGSCVSGSPPSCDDQNPCTYENCDPSAGCVHSPIEDGRSCDVGRCGAGVCQAGVCSAGGVALCDDGNPCTEDYCIPEVGCQIESLVDGYACGECMMCVSGACVDAPDCGTDGCGCSATDGRPAAVWWRLALGLLLALRRPR